MSDNFEYIETITCLRQSFSVVDNIQRSIVEKRIKELADLQLSCIIYLKNLIEKKIDLNFLDKTLAHNILKNIIDIIIPLNLSNSSLKTLSEIILKLLNYVEISNDGKIVFDISSRLADYCKSNTTEKLNSFKGIFTIFECIIGSESIIPSNAVLIIKTLLDGSRYVINSLLDVMKSVKLPDNMKTLMNYYDICKVIYHFLYMVSLKAQLRYKNFHNLESIFIEIFLNPAILLISSHIPEINNETVISWTKQAEIDNTINDMKSQCLQFVESLVKYYSCLLDERIIKVVSVLIETILKDLTYVIENRYDFLSNFERDENKFPNFNYEKIIYRMLSCLNNFLMKEPIIMHFYQFSRKLLTNLILPLIVTTESEREEMVEDPEKYDGFVTDLLTKKKAQKIKTVACCILNRVCKKYDGLDTFLMEYLISKLENVLKQEGINSQNEDYFERFNLESKIETIFLVLADISDYVETNTKYLTYLKNIIEVYFEKIHNFNSQLINLRLCLFYGKFLNILFIEKEDKVSMCLSQLLNFTISNNNGLKYQAIQTLNHFVKNKEFTKILDILIKNYIDNLMNLITEIQNIHFFDFLLEISKTYEIDGFLLKLIKSLVSRILIEAKVYERKKKNQNIQNFVLVKSFNIIKTITEKEKYVIKYLNEIEEIFYPVLEYMKNVKKIDFDEDILVIVTNFIRLSKSIPKSLIFIFPFLEKYYSKVDCLMLDLFELINFTIIYGKPFLLSNKKNLEFVISLFERSLIDDRVYEKSPLLGCSLMNILLFSVDNIPEENISKIISFAQNQLIQINVTDQVLRVYINTFNKYLALLGVIYSGFIKYPKITLEVLQNDLSNLLEITDIMLKSKFYTIYQTKVIILGICGLLTSGVLTEKDFESYFSRFMNFIISLLRNQEKEERSVMKKTYNNLVDSNFNESDEEDEEEEDYNEDFEENKIQRELDENYYQEAREIRDLYDRLLCPSKSFDEYEIFKMTVQKSRESNIRVFELWYSSLSIKEKELLTKIVKIKRVEINSFYQTTGLDSFPNLTANITYNIPRTIVKIKRGNNN